MLSLIGYGYSLSKSDLHMKHLKQFIIKSQHFDHTVPSLKHKIYK